jgi:hypothetical protein
VGNSYAVQFVPMLEQWAKDRGWRIELAARTDCLGLSTSPVAGQQSGDTCVAWSRAVQDRLLHEPGLGAAIFVAHEQSLTYLAGKGATPKAADEAEQNVLATLGRLKKAGIGTMVIKHAPGTRPASAPECVALSAASYDPCTRDPSQVTEDDMLSQLAQKHPALTQFVSLDDFFCDAEACHAAIGGTVAYYDDHHISSTFARTLAQYVGPMIDKAMGAGTV